MKRRWHDPLTEPDGLPVQETADGKASAPRQAASPNPGDGALSQHERSRWQRLLPSLEHPARALLATAPPSETHYVIEQAYSPHAWRFGEETLRIVLVQRRRLKGGALSKPTAVGQVPSRAAPPGSEGIVWNLARSSADSVAYLSAALTRTILPELCASGRVGSILSSNNKIEALSWDPGLPWGLTLQIEEHNAEGAARRGNVEVQGCLERGEGAARETLALSQVREVFDTDLFVHASLLSALRPGHGKWARELLRGPLRSSPRELKALVAALMASPGAPRLINPELVGLSTARRPASALVKLRLPRKNGNRVFGNLVFRYGEVEVGTEQRPLIAAGELLVRDYARETALLEGLRELGVRVTVGSAGPDGAQPLELEMGADAVVVAAELLLRLDVTVLVEGRQYRKARHWHPVIESHQDWFNLKADADFDGELVALPLLLAAIRRKERWVRLKDGSVGLLPEAWLPSLERLTELLPAKPTERLHVAQALMIDGALAGAVQLGSDAGYNEAKQRFQNFAGVQPLPEPQGFRGKLRPYQRRALGWLEALDGLGLGGCLADDMGLGKTVVVLAWLQRCKSRRARRQRDHGSEHGRDPVAASLLVVPRSLLFNWQREAERFTPELKVLLHHGLERKPPGAEFSDFDLVLTSYGTLRRDASSLAQLSFDYLILDEAHNIKNAWTEAHKAARGLSSRRRLALTGTPLENHLGELWNLLSFLNPGVFDSFNHLRKTFEKRRPSAVALERVILTSIKPFVLRRTKAEVASDLPQRVEKVLEVTLSTSERKLYDELAEYYRKRLIESRRIRKNTGRGGPSKPDSQQMAQHLQALLRLRQAACHPGLIDDQRQHLNSSKLEILVQRLSALAAEGHKALVFSQFTSLLKLLVPHLDQAGIQHAYLDGRTVDREGAVRRFQEDPAVGAFLISLKAGGVGLNLVAADYVFLLDPWWNPASEAQAIDRAHRIGQRRTVIAYRLLAKDTIEQKVAALQEEKRELAEALFGDPSQFAAKWTQEDLEALLSS